VTSARPAPEREPWCLASKPHWTHEVVLYDKPRVNYHRFVSMAPRATVEGARHRVPRRHWVSLENPPRTSVLPREVFPSIEPRINPKWEIVIDDTASPLLPPRLSFSDDEMRLNRRCPENHQRSSRAHSRDRRLNPPPSAVVLSPADNAKAPKFCPKSWPPHGLRRARHGLARAFGALVFPQCGKGPPRFLESDEGRRIQYPRTRTVCPPSIFENALPAI